MLDKIAKYHTLHPEAVFYVNVSEGIEAIPWLEILGIDYRFVKISSSAVEQKQYNEILCRLGSDILMNLAMGKHCVVVDYGCRKEVSRACYEGVPFIKAFLEYKWFNKKFKDVYITPRKNKSDFTLNVTNDFIRYLTGIDRKTSNYIKFYKKYTTMNMKQNVNLDFISEWTNNSRNVDFHLACLGSKIQIEPELRYDSI